MQDHHSFIFESLVGMSAVRKTIPTGLLYDEKGSALFNEIIRQPEYYPAWAERTLLGRHASDVLDAMPLLQGAPLALLELGASDETKAAPFLDAPLGVRFATYIGVNLERTVLESLEQRLKASHPRLQVQIIWTDFLKPINVPPLPPNTKVIAFFPGSTMGQLTPTVAIDFLAAVRRIACAFIIGFDICQDPARILPAYDDAAGANAVFNLNALTHLNRLGDGDFDAKCFQHVVRWDPQQARVEMYLQSLHAQTIHLAGRTFHFAAGEIILTGVSYKRTPEAFAHLAVQAGWTPADFWSDPENLFGMQLLLAANGDGATA